MSENRKSTITWDEFKKFSNTSQLKEYLPKQTNKFGQVYLLLGSVYRISRSMWVQWIFQNIYETAAVTIRSSADLELTKNSELEVLSVIHDEDSFVVSPRTLVCFVSRRYKICFCLDLSINLLSFNKETELTLLNECYLSLIATVQTLSQSLTVENSTVEIAPYHIITIIGFYQTDNKNSPVEQNIELVTSNFLLNDSPNNLKKLIYIIKTKFALIEKKLIALSQKSNACTNSFLHKINICKVFSYCVNCLDLFPTNITSILLFFSDGVFDDAVCVDSTGEAVVDFLQVFTVMFCFIMLGPVQPHNYIFGHIPNLHFVNYVTDSSSGAFTSAHEILVEKFEHSRYRKEFASLKNKTSCVQLTEHKLIQRLFLAWTFQVGDNFKKLLDQKDFFSYEIYSDFLPVRLSCILCCRAREGFMINSLSFHNSLRRINISLVYPVFEGGFIEYACRATWQDSVQNYFPSVTVTLCKSKRENLFKSGQTSSKNEQMLMQRIRLFDKLLVDLYSFNTDAEFYDLPPNFFFYNNGCSRALFKNAFGDMSDLTLACDKHMILTNEKFVSFWFRLLFVNEIALQKLFHCHYIRFVYGGVESLSGDASFYFTQLFEGSSFSFSFSIKNKCDYAFLLEIFNSELSDFCLVENTVFVKFLLLRDTVFSKNGPVYAFEKNEKAEKTEKIEKISESPASSVPYSFYLIKIESNSSLRDLTISVCFLAGTHATIRASIVQHIVNTLKEKKEHSTSLHRTNLDLVLVNIAMTDNNNKFEPNIKENSIENAIKISSLTPLNHLFFSVRYGGGVGYKNVTKVYANFINYLIKYSEFELFLIDSNEHFLKFCVNCDSYSKISKKNYTVVRRGVLQVTLFPSFKDADKNECVVMMLSSEVSYGKARIHNSSTSLCRRKKMFVPHSIFKYFVAVQLSKHFVKAQMMFDIMEHLYKKKNFLKSEKLKFNKCTFCEHKIDSGVFFVNANKTKKTLSSIKKIVFFSENKNSVKASKMDSFCDQHENNVKGHHVNLEYRFDLNFFLKQTNVKYKFELPLFNDINDSASLFVSQSTLSVNKTAIDLLNGILKNYHGKLTDEFKNFYELKQYKSVKEFFFCSYDENTVDGVFCGQVYSYVCYVIDGSYFCLDGQENILIVVKVPADAITFYRDFYSLKKNKPKKNSKSNKNNRCNSLMRMRSKLLHKKSRCASESFGDPNQLVDVPFLTTKVYFLCNDVASNLFNTTFNLESSFFKFRMNSINNLFFENLNHKIDNHIIKISQKNTKATAEYKKNLKDLFFLLGKIYNRNMLLVCYTGLRSCVPISSKVTRNLIDCICREHVTKLDLHPIYSNYNDQKVKFDITNRNSLVNRKLTTVLSFDFEQIPDKQNIYFYKRGRNKQKVFPLFLQLACAVAFTHSHTQIRTQYVDDSSSFRLVFDGKILSNFIECEKIDRYTLYVCLLTTHKIADLEGFRCNETCTILTKKQLGAIFYVHDGLNLLVAQETMYSGGVVNEAMFVNLIERRTRFVETCEYYKKVNTCRNFYEKSFRLSRVVSGSVLKRALTEYLNGFGVEKIFFANRMVMFVEQCKDRYEFMLVGSIEYSEENLKMMLTHDIFVDPAIVDYVRSEIFSSLCSKMESMIYEKRIQRMLQNSFVRWEFVLDEGLFFYSSMYKNRFVFSLRLYSRLYDKDSLKFFFLLKDFEGYYFDNNEHVFVVNKTDNVYNIGCFVLEGEEGRRALCFYSLYEINNKQILIDNVSSQIKLAGLNRFKDYVLKTEDCPLNTEYFFNDEDYLFLTSGEFLEGPPAFVTYKNYVIDNRLREYLRQQLYYRSIRVNMTDRYKDLFFFIMGPDISSLILIEVNIKVKNTGGRSEQQPYDWFQKMIDFVEGLNVEVEENPDEISDLTVYRGEGKMDQIVRLMKRTVTSAVFDLVGEGFLNKIDRKKRADYFEVSNFFGVLFFYLQTNSLQSSFYCRTFDSSSSLLYNKEYMIGKKMRAILENTFEKFDFFSLFLDINKKKFIETNGFVNFVEVEGKKFCRPVNVCVLERVLIVGEQKNDANKYFVNRRSYILMAIKCDKISFITYNYKCSEQLISLLNKQVQDMYKQVLLKLKYTQLMTLQKNGLFHVAKRKFEYDKQKALQNNSVTYTNQCRNFHQLFQTLVCDGSSNFYTDVLAEIFSDLRIGVEQNNMYNFNLYDLMDCENFLVTTKTNDRLLLDRVYESDNYAVYKSALTTKVLSILYHKHVLSQKVNTFNAVFECIQKSSGTVFGASLFEQQIVDFVAERNFVLTEIILLDERMKLYVFDTAVKYLVFNFYLGVSNVLTSKKKRYINYYFVKEGHKSRIKKSSKFEEVDESDVSAMLQFAKNSAVYIVIVNIKEGRLFFKSYCVENFFSKLLMGKKKEVFNYEKTVQILRNEKFMDKIYLLSCFKILKKYLTNRIVDKEVLVVCINFLRRTDLRKKQKLKKDGIFEYAFSKMVLRFDILESYESDFIFAQMEFFVRTKKKEVLLKQINNNGIVYMLNETIYLQHQKNVIMLSRNSERSNESSANDPHSNVSMSSGAHQDRSRKVTDHSGQKSDISEKFRNEFEVLFEDFVEDLQKRISYGKINSFFGEKNVIEEVKSKDTIESIITRLNREEKSVFFRHFKKLFNAVDEGEKENFLRNLQSEQTGRKMVRVQNNLLFKYKENVLIVSEHSAVVCTLYEFNKKQVKTMLDDILNVCRLTCFFCMKNLIE